MHAEHVRVPFGELLSFLGRGEPGVRVAARAAYQRATPLRGGVLVGAGTMHYALPNESVDVVISNCVINLSADKPSVLREAFRVLKPGGRFAVSDVVVQGELPAALRQSMELLVGCIAGALEEDTYRKLLDAAGFRQVGLEVTRIYDAEGLAASECCGNPAAQAGLAQLTAKNGRIVSAFVRATKPLTDAALFETHSNAR